MHILDMGWRTENRGFQSYLYLQNIDGKRKEISLEPGRDIDWKFTAPRRCIGYYENDQWAPCPNHAVLRKNQIRCRTCSTLNEYSPCIQCRGKTCFANEKRRKKCMETRYAVYLALFGDDIIKVGVSTLSRLLLRWVEQGADYGAMIAEIEGGLNAREIERMVAKRAEISDAIHGTRKQAIMTSRLAEKDAEVKILGVMDDSGIHNLEQSPEIVDLSPYYGFEAPPSDPLRWPENNETIHNSTLDGKILGVKGSNILVKRESILFVADLRRLLGYDLACSQLSAKSIKQSGLENFL